MWTRLTAPARASRAVPTVLTVAALLAGCDAGEVPSPQPAATPSSSASATTTSPAPTSPALPNATDGTNLAACQDADCEVEVRVGDRLDVDAAFGVDAITVTSVEQDEITVALQGSSGGFDVEGEEISISSNCSNGRCRDEGELSLTTSRPGRINEVQISLTGTDSDRAVLVLLPR
jgi:hypothetical protein